MHGVSADEQSRSFPETVRAWRERLARSSWLAVETRLPAGEGVRIEWRKGLVDWAVIFFVVLAFCAPFVQLGSARALPGLEAEVFQSLDLVLTNALKQHGQFPLWNPQLQTGLPFVADPFLHVYNPLATVPVLLLGVQDGFKVALFLSFLAAAYGMWLLGAVLGVGRPARLWMALMFAFSGQAVARFFQGEYDFVLGYAWIPWVFAALIATVRTGRGRWAALAAASLALIFFSGNVYYAYYMAIIMALFAAVALVGVRREQPHIVLHWGRARWLLLVGVLALGLVALQLLPLIHFWPSIVKAGDAELAGSHTLGQIIQDYLSKDPWRPDAIATLPREEFYAYIGIAPFLLLLLLPAVAVALRRAGRTLWPLVFFGLLILFSFAWIDMRDMPWAGLIRGSEFLNQFRYPTRMLMFGGVGIIALAGLGLDWLWGRVAKPRTTEAPRSLPALARWAAPATILLGLMAFTVVSAGDVFSTNRERVQTRDPYPISYNIMRWLRDNVPGEYYVGNDNGWHGSVLSAGLRYIDAWYGFSFNPPLQGAVNARRVRATPNYLVLGNDQRPPYPDAEVLLALDTHTVYLLPHSLPFSFVVSNQQLQDANASRDLWSDDVTGVVPVKATPNRVDLTLNGTPVSGGGTDATLVVLTSAFDGWRLLVDGRPAPMHNVGGYLAATLQPGRHTYSFQYSLPVFWAGLVISLLSLIALGVLAFGLRRRLAVVRRLPAIKAPTTMQAEAIYEGGMFKPSEPLPLAEGTVVRLTWESILAAPAVVGPPETAPAEAALVAPPETAPAGAASVPVASREREAVRQRRLQWVLFGMGLVVYLFTRLYALDRFPIFFFADEAVHSVLAQDLVDRDFKDAQGKPFPIYFEAAGNRWTPLLSVYVHAATETIAGKSILTNRGTSALVSLFAAASVSLILGLIFKKRYWWMGGLLMALAPAWFLHSRTGFETVMMASFFACFLLCYLLYRTRNPNFLFAAVLFGAATFYTYSNGQMIIVAAGALLLLSDLRYHLKHWPTVLLAGLLVLVLAVPLIRFSTSQPASLTTHLRAIDSYWFEPKPLTAKLEQFAKTYAYGLSPQYWFIPNEHDLARHRMKDYGNMALPFLPFFVIGLAVCLRRIRSAPHRDVLMALLATPAGASLVDVGITRVLVFTVPATILVGLGIEATLDFVRKRVRWRVPYAASAAVIFLVLAGASLWMLRDVLVNGPFWYSDYGLYGMQYGAKQLFQEAVPEVLAQDPNNRVMMTSSWANGADTFIRFFLPKDQQSRVQMLSIDYYMDERRPLDQNTLVVMTPAEYQKALSSQKFSKVDVKRVVPYPDGSPGFYFARLEYSPQFDEILAPEREARVTPVDETFMLDGQQVNVSHSPFDMGQLSNVFDGDTFTLARGMAANPLVIDLTFPEPRSIQGLAADLGSMDFKLTASLFGTPDGEPVIFSEEYRGLPADPHVDIPFPGAPERVSRVRLEIEQFNPPQDVHIHVRELKFQ